MGIDAGAIRELTEALDGKRPDQQPTVARARVVQSDGGGTWVQLDGGAARTPVASSTVAVRQGDEVMVRIDGGSAVITGNVSRPSTDDSALKVLERAMDAFKRRVSDLNGNVSEIRQSADGIATRVENVEGSVASMENTAEGWSWVTSVKNQAAAANTAAEKAATDAANAQSSADEAAKTATDYMSFTGGVLDVGAKDASGNMKGHVSIKNNGLSVVDQNLLVLLNLIAWSDAGGKYTVLDMAHDASGYKATIQSDAYEGEGARVMFGMRAPDGSVYGLMVYGDVGSQIIGDLEVAGSLSANGKSVSLSGHTHTKGQVGFDGYVSDVTTTHETFSGYTIQPSGTTTSPGYYRTISKKPSSPGTGYEAIGIVGVYTNHYATVMVGGYYIDSSGAINVQLRNHGSSKYTDLNVDVIVLWRKRY